MTISMLLLSLQLALLPTLSNTFSPGWLVQRLPGIWKLQTDALPYDEPDIRSRLKGLIVSSDKKMLRSDDDNSILLKLNQDGTFKQCDEGYIEGKWISGNWQLVEDLSSTKSDKIFSHRLVLAMNRQYYGPQFDVVLDGCFDSDGDAIRNDDVYSRSNLKFQGNVQKGKFLHPRGHTSFFDPPFLASPETAGLFTLEQSLATFSILGDRNGAIDERDDATKTTKAVQQQIQHSDFHDKNFIMTIEPLKQSKARAEQFINQPVDIRSLPVSFFANNTFCATGTNKILRGRYQVRLRQDDDGGSFELSMAVSLFGAGRSAPGSVYSEGLGLTHEDERTYTGTIQQQTLLADSGSSNEKRFYVQGTVFFGTDLGEDARPEPVATFYLIEDTASRTGRITVSRSEDEENDSPFAATGGVFE